MERLPAAVARLRIVLKAAAARPLNVSRAAPKVPNARPDACERSVQSPKRVECFADVEAERIDNLALNDESTYLTG